MGDTKVLVQTVAGFFRVFDIAFFLPGAVVLFAASEFRVIPQWPSEWFASVGQAVEAIILSFVIGLVCHAAVRIARMTWRGIRKGRSTCIGKLFAKSGARGQSPDYRRTDEVRLYLWNLGSLSWNLATAMVAVGVLAFFSDTRWWAFVAAVAALLLAFQGLEFRTKADS